MLSILVIGAPRQGKSNYCKQMINSPQTRSKACYVFDPRNEYGDQYKTKIGDTVKMVPGVGLPANQPQLKRSRYTGGANGVDKNFFKAIVKQKKDTIIVFEESTGFLKGKIPDDMNDLLTGRFHNGNTFVFVFHSLETVPPDMIRNNACDIIVLFKTLDNPDTASAKFKNPYITLGLQMQIKKENKAAPTVIKPLDGVINGKELDPQEVNRLLTGQNSLF